MRIDKNTPFALSLSKGTTERSEISLRSMQGFDKSSPNGNGARK